MEEILPTLALQLDAIIGYRSYNYKMHYIFVFWDCRVVEFTKFSLKLCLKKIVRMTATQNPNNNKKKI